MIYGLWCPGEKVFTLDFSLPYGKVNSLQLLTDVYSRERWYNIQARTFYIFCKRKRYGISSGRNWRSWSSPSFSHPFSPSVYSCPVLSGDLTSSQVCYNAGERLQFLSTGMQRCEHLSNSRRYLCIQVNPVQKQIIIHRMLMRPRVFQKYYIFLKKEERVLQGIIKKNVAWFWV